MRYSNFIFILFLAACIQSIAQTTSFKDNRWFDPKKDNWYKYPNQEQAEVIVSNDSMIAHLGSKIIRYKIKGVTDIRTKTKSSREFKVENNGTEFTISITRTMEEYFGRKRQIGWIGGGGWIVLSPLTSITPLGYLFPGDVAIDIKAECDRIVGYYEYDFVRRKDAEQYKINGGYASIIWTDDKCKKDVQIELRSDNTGTWWSGHKEKGCAKKAEQTFAWKLEQVVNEGRRAMMLTLTDNIESNQYIIDELTDKKLSLKGEFNLGNEDTTTTAYLVLSRKKKK